VLTAEAGPVAGGPAEFGGSFGEFFFNFYIIFFDLSKYMPIFFAKMSSCSQFNWRHDGIFEKKIEIYF